MIDLAKIQVRAGNGGDGRVSFRRMKFMPKGGPDGGDGGRGGSVYLVGNKDINTLQTFLSKQRYKAQPGGMGGKNSMTGAGADDIEIKVPVGTVVHAMTAADGTGNLKEFFGEILQDGQRLLVAKGGKGGRGNEAFKSSINQAPQEAEKGVLGEQRQLMLELKLLANIGLVGLPNVGKSSLLARLTRAKPEIANYPFTTLSPNLGVTFYEESDAAQNRSLVIADIPGLIEGASKGKGLGLEFLRHVERCHLLVFVLALDEIAIFDEILPVKEKIEMLHKQLTMLKDEMKQYNTDLLEKRSMVVVNKADLYDKKLRDHLKKAFDGVVLCSAATNEGVEELKERVFSLDTV